jgi:hypothetical protein
MYTVDNREGLVPFINYFELYVGVKSDIKKVVINNGTAALLVKCRIENNELSIEFTTWAGDGIRKLDDPTFMVTIPYDAVLFRKKYNLDDRYDISQSYPYYIHEVTPNYIFTTDSVLEQNPHYRNNYIRHSGFSYAYVHGIKGHMGFDSMNGINILKSDVQTIIQLKRSYAKEKRKLGVLIVEAINEKGFIGPDLITVLNLHKAQNFLQEKTYTQNRHSEPFVDASQFMFKVDIKGEIRRILKLNEREFRNINNRLVHFTHVDEAEGFLYILIVLLPKKVNKKGNNDNNDECDTIYWLCKCNILNPKVSCEVIAKLHLTNSGKVKDFIGTDKHSVYLLQILSKANCDNKRLIMTYNLTHIHDDILIMTGDRLDIKLIDTKRNRESTLQYLKQIPEIVSAHMYRDVRGDDYLVYRIGVNPRFGTYHEVYYPLVLMDLDLVKSNQMD